MTTDNELIKQAIDYMNEKSCTSQKDLIYLDNIYNRLKNDDSKSIVSLLGDNICKTNKDD